VIVGFARSTTVRPATHEAVLPAPSVAVMITFVTPSPTSVPAAGFCETTTAPQLSVATVPAVKSGTAAWQFASAETVTLGAQVVMDGLVVSTTVKVAEQVAVFPAPSVAVIVTLCGPRPTSVPASGLCVIVTGPQLSVAVVPAA
jgi:hypothetical protein